MIGTYYRLSLADEDVGADKAESNSIQGQRGLVEGYIMARPELAAEPRQEYVDATDIIGLKQNPTNGRRFSPIFLCIGHFSE